MQKGPRYSGLGKGSSASRKGVNVFRACAMLPALTAISASQELHLLFERYSCYRWACRNSPICREPQSESGPNAVSQMDMPRLLQDSSAIRSF